ncbi:thiamine-phosphate synthase [Arenibacter algicola]|jgi:thiamine-phosphate pyrophosphorylase|uniref:Thiamine-phosphate synthase n=2 Tax=Arenibacter algicola TaxID=616991 RepID=A0A221V1K6_9FLAO|nr:thiamine-phosphate synthase [Arenibacter algicola]|tara:strand:- start:71538 stop:72203 length:666 start_codon:yes stop_codon:yes gene_type:complete
MEIIGSKKRTMGTGIYLIIDPSMDELTLLNKLNLCLREKLAAVQIWDNFKDNRNLIELINKIIEECHAKNVPVLINNRWELLNTTLLDGVHFDVIPENYTEIKRSITKPFISGLTCNNDLTLVEWASKNKLDYISFCSIFPSQTANSCEIVNFNTIHDAARNYGLPIYLAGGIKPENIHQLDELKYTGIAVVSGIMSTNKPNESIKKYLEKLKKNENRNHQ